MARRKRSPEENARREKILMENGVLVKGYRPNPWQKTVIQNMQTSGGMANAVPLSIPPQIAHLNRSN